MFKKIAIVLLVVLVCCGIGYLGYVVFMAKNIVSVEMVGEMQTVYFEGDDIDFENAQLKVTYKNGDMKMIDMNKSTVDVTLFSTSQNQVTSISGVHNTMKITYKNFTIEQEYNVFKPGCYFVDGVSTTTVATGNVDKKDYSNTTTNFVYYFYTNGQLRYYHKDAANDWIMNDGLYDSTYNYTIKGDTIKVNLGKNKSIELKPHYEKNQALYLVSSEVENLETNTNVPARYIDSTYGYYAGMKSDRKISQDEKLTYIDYSKSGTTNNYITFKVGEKFNTRNEKVYLKLTYTNDEFLKTVYIEICDEMNVKIDTTHSFPGATSNSTTTYFYYGKGNEGSFRVRLDYKVE